MFQNLTFMSPFKHVTPINNNNELNMTDYWRSIVQQRFFQTWRPLRPSLCWFSQEHSPKTKFYRQRATHRIHYWMCWGMLLYGTSKVLVILFTAFIMNFEVFWPELSAGIAPDTFRKIITKKNVEATRSHGKQCLVLWVDGKQGTEVLVRLFSFILSSK